MSRTPSMQPPLRPWPRPFRRTSAADAAAAPGLGGRLAICRDVLDIVWKLLPLWLVVPGLGIWLYLRDAGWESLFLDAVVSWSGLGVLLAAGVLGCLLPTLFIVSPALIFFGGLRDTLADRAARGARFSATARLAAMTMLGWLAVLAGARGRIDAIERWMPGAGIGGYLLAGGVLCLGGMLLAAVLARKPLRREWEAQAGFGRWLACAAGLGAALMLTSLAPFLVLVALLEPLADALGFVFSLALVLALTFALSFLPVLALLSTPAQASRRGKMTVWTIVVFGVVVLLAGQYGSLVQWVLKPMGVYQTGTMMYLLAKPEAAAAASAAGLPPVSVKGAQAVRGYQRFALGGVLLLCQQARTPPGQARGAGCVALRRDDAIPYLQAPAVATPGIERPRAKRPRRMETGVSG